MGDWPLLDQLTVSLSSNATSITVADSALYSGNWLLQIDDETLLTRSAPSSGTTVTVFRGHLGTTAASHANSSSILVKPAFADVEYLDALNAGLEASFPLLYQRVQDESLTAAPDDWEYNIPDLNSVPIPYISKVWVKTDGDLIFREKRDWHVIRGATPILVFDRGEDGTVRIDGFGPFPSLTSSSSTLSDQWPANADTFLTTYAAQWLLSSGEGRRVRHDVGPHDARENANRTGSSMAAANHLFNRAQNILARVAMAPMPKHVRPTF